MRVWHVVLGSLALVALVFMFALHRAADPGSASVAKPTPAYRAPAPARTPAPAAAAAPASRRMVPVKPYALGLGRPRVQSATAARQSAGRRAAYDPPPVAPGPPPTIPADIAAEADGPDVCVTDPPKSLDECARMLSAESMDACIQYRVDCYG
jgi:hypothetical protein